MSTGSVPPRSSWLHCMLFLGRPTDFVGHFTQPACLLKLHTLPLTSAGWLGTSHYYYYYFFTGAENWRARMRCVSSVSISFTWWAPFQLFSRCSPHLKGRKSGDVKLIPDTKGEKAAERKCSIRLWEPGEWTPEYRCWRRWEDRCCGGKTPRNTHTPICDTCGEIHWHLSSH